jgi:hypothetical protein
MSDVHKQRVIDRLRQGHQWCARHGPPYQWIRDLFADAAQELQNESGSLWLQWMTGRTGHVRVFVAGDFGTKELDALLKVLHLQREHMAEWEARKEPPQPEPAALGPQE